ncbi:hypothetical protein MKZ38_005923 [Zalerion maritima]|uniref:NACHT domain-containing protein n=1 Tax=Zalerion maritima TaxID=339359 RepID=A0AAD5RJT1_9PEZI|nr:hypothetical protein MKZ38_005923 [Zalerion maritima]
MSRPASKRSVHTVQVLSEGAPGLTVMMALVPSSLPSSSSQLTIDPAKHLEEAVSDFHSVLTGDERTRLQTIKTIPDADSVLIFTAQLDYSSRTQKGRSIASRLHSVLQSVREFSTVAGAFASSHPEIAGLVWGSVKLTMLCFPKIVVNFTSHFDGLSNLFMGFSALCPRFAEYGALFPTSTRLQKALCNYHASIIRCCKHAVEAIRRPLQQFFSSFWQSFDQEFKPDVEDVKRWANEVREEIALAKAQADYQDQELGKKEREDASSHRQKVKAFLSRTGNDIDMFKEKQLERDVRRYRKHRQRLLHTLSSHDYRSPFREARKARHYGTAQWIFPMLEFSRWNDGTGPSVLWCYGKIGSGKTVLSASVIDHILVHKRGPQERVVFFFVQYDNPQPLKAETVLRSIIRQSLDPDTMSRDMENMLNKIDQGTLSGVKDLVALLRRIIASFKLYYVIIDAVDEYERPEQGRLLGVLSSLSANEPRMRLFLSSRESLSVVLRRKFQHMECVSMGSSQTSSDISLYVREYLQEQEQNGYLVVGDRSLLGEIKDALVRHADGMFLWVVYLIDELCTQHCDDDIRRSLRNLPKNLEETFERALSRIVSRQKTAIVQKIFPWVAVAKRHLTLDELREALSIEIGQQSSRPERLINGIERIASWCENLLRVDEELKTVEFFHHTVHDFITRRCLRPDLEGFRVDPEDADHYAGEICVTYLHWNDFKTTLARRPQPIPPIMPAAIAQTALGSRSKMAKLMPRRKMLDSKSVKHRTELDLVGSLASYGREDTNETWEKQQQGHPFLAYASEHWISHTTDFREEKSTTWKQWQSLVVDDHDLAQKPWSEHEFEPGHPHCLGWSLKANHLALVRQVASPGCLSKSASIKWIFDTALATGDTALAIILLQEKCILSKEVNNLLMKFCQGGYLGIIEPLLTAGGSLEYMEMATRHGFHVHRTPLEAASKNNHPALVERLIALGAYISTPASEFGYTALQAASANGHQEIVERLIALGADINAPASQFGFTALQAASENGHQEIVERLIALGADINAPASKIGYTALQAASKNGHQEIVERLIALGADINAPASEFRFTALQAASGNGHQEIVEQLEQAGARR